ncbi:MAG: hypothetical protein KGJ02_01935 [Verrucomicrobiota bacterium]|nr:hypothetical protein [Verrucomicrobiota bacterium]
MNISSPKLREIMYFLADVKPLDEKIASPMVDVSTVGILAHGVSRVDVESEEWTKDLLPRVLEVAEIFLSRHPWMIGNCSFSKWGLQPKEIDNLLLRIVRKAPPFKAFEEDKNAPLVSLLFQTNTSSIRFSLASSLLQLDALSEKIGSFGFSEWDRVRLALKGITLKFEKVSQNIRYYAIANASDRYEIALKGLSSNAAAIGSISRYLPQFDLDEEQCSALARVAAKHKAHEFFKHFKNYRIKKESDRIEIVKSALPAESEEVCKHLHNCEIENLEAIFEIAKLLEPEHAFQVALQYPLPESRMVELFRLSAEKSYKCSEWISPKTVPNEKHRAELFQILTRYKYFNYEENLQKFEIRDPQLLLTLAENDAKDEKFCERVKLYRMEQVEDRIRLAKVSIVADHFDPIHLSNFDIPQELASPVWNAYLIADPKKIREDAPQLPQEVIEKITPELQCLEENAISDTFLATRTPPFKALYQKLKEERDGVALCHELASMQARVQILHSLHSFSSEELEALDQLALALGETWTPEEREHFGRQFSLYFLDRAKFDVWFRSLPRTEDRRLIKHCLVPSTCCSILNLDNRNEWIQALHRKGRIFRDGKKAKILISFLFLAHLNQPKGKTLVEQIFYGDEDPYQRTILLSSLFSFCQFSLPSLSFKDLLELREKVFFEELNLPPVFHPDRMQELLKGLEWRDPQAIPTYSSKIKQLPQPNQEAVKKYYSKWLQSILTNTISILRLKSPHRIEIRKRMKDPTTLRAWENERPPKTIVLQGNEKKDPLEKQFINFLRKKLIEDRHVAPGIFPVLEAYLNDSSLPTTSDHPLEQTLLALCQKATFEGITSLKNTVPRQGELSDFRVDLEEFHKWLSAEKNTEEKSQEFRIYDTCNPEDILLLGSETGGCQSIYRDPQNNQAALGYTDWKNRVIVVKKPNSPITIARAIFRFMWDETAKKPALFLEGTYSLFPDDRLATEIEKYALEVGDQLQLEVFTAPIKEIPEEKRYLGMLISFGSLAPLEYTDAFRSRGLWWGGGVTQGAFRGNGTIFLKEKMKCL